MRAITFIAFFAFLLQWPSAAFAQDLAMLNSMSVAERISWLVRYNDQELCQKDSVTAFRETNELLTLADKWNDPEFAVEVYSGQGKYRLQVLKDPENALRTLSRGEKFFFVRHLDVCAARLQLQKADVYCKSGQPILAYENFIRAHNQFSKIGFSGIPQIDQYELAIACFLVSIGDFPTALDHLAIADLFPGKVSAVQYKIQLLKAYCYQQSGRHERVLNCFQKALRLAQKENDTAKMAATSVDMGEYYIHNQDYSEAR
ncbi:MAG: tetratricopeptide repeat protein, partial [Saprospiraceae bacterium]